MDLERIREIFFPYQAERKKHFQNRFGRFVHYTSASVVTRIIQNKQIWMRNTAVMNDSSEIEFGFTCLDQAYRSTSGTELLNSVDDVFPGLSKESQDSFNAWLPSIRKDTYITCYSEHDSSEDIHGRLSMWRAYGGDTGIAVVMNSTAMFAVPSHPVGVYSSAVAYEGKEAVEGRLRLIAQRIAQNKSFVSGLGREQVKRLMFNMYRYAVVSTKHPGFSEEKEWRAISCLPLEQSPLLESGVEVIDGIPQTILKINLENKPEIGVVGLGIPDLIDRLIIGPCKFPETVQRTLCQLLEDAGVKQPKSRVVISGIPLRT